jgi:hypothetical protein
MMGHIFFGLAFLVAATSEVPYRAASIEQDLVTVAATRVVLKGAKLWVRLAVVNDSQRSVIIDKREIKARLHDGAVVQRETGVFGKEPKPVVVPAGASHDINIEFGVGEAALPVSIILDGAISTGSRTLPIANLVAYPQQTSELPRQTVPFAFTSPDFRNSMNVAKPALTECFAKRARAQDAGTVGTVKLAVRKDQEWLEVLGTGKAFTEASLGFCVTKAVAGVRLPRDAVATSFVTELEVALPLQTSEIAD